MQIAKVFGFHSGQQSEIICCVVHTAAHLMKAVRHLSLLQPVPDVGRLEAALRKLSQRT